MLDEETHRRSLLNADRVIHCVAVFFIVGEKQTGKEVNRNVFSAGSLVLFPDIYDIQKTKGMCSTTERGQMSEITAFADA